jgi:uncharacterized membrane protein
MHARNLRLSTSWSYWLKFLALYKIILSSSYIGRWFTVNDFSFRVTISNNFFTGSIIDKYQVSFLVLDRYLGCTVLIEQRLLALCLSCVTSGQFLLGGHTEMVLQRTVCTMQCIMGRIWMVVFVLFWNFVLFLLQTHHGWSATVQSACFHDWSF